MGCISFGRALAAVARPALFSVFLRRFFTSIRMELVSSHMLTSAPKNMMYMQENSQNIKITKVARLP